MTPLHVLQLLVAIWLLCGHASYWHALHYDKVDLYNFFGRGYWYLGAAVVTLLGPFTIPTYYILTGGGR